MIRREGDRKDSGPRTWWGHINQDALMGSVVEYVEKEWAEVNGLVRKKHVGMSLLTHDGEIGIVMPPALIYIFHARMENKRDIFPVEHVDMNLFRDQYLFHIARLRRGMNIVLLDQGNPYVALGSKLFRDGNLEIKDTKGHIDFRDELKRGFYYDSKSSALPELTTEQSEWLKDFYRHASIYNKQRHEILTAKARPDAKDKKILEHVISKLKLVRDDYQNNYERVVANLFIDLETGNVLDFVAHTKSEPTNQPTNET